MYYAEVCIDERSVVEHRLDDEVRTIDVWGTYDLDVNLSCCHLGYEGADILVDILCEHRLYEENVVMAFDRLENAQIINISVII